MYEYFYKDFIIIILIILLNFDYIEYVFMDKCCFFLFGYVYNNYCMGK